MKTPVILLVMVLCLLSYAGWSQKVTIARTNAHLEEILLDINKQTGYYYSASTQALESAKCVTIDVKNAELDHVLTVCFKDQSLVYSIRGNIILIKKSDVKERLTEEKEIATVIRTVPIRKLFITECKLV